MLSILNFRTLYKKTLFFLFKRVQVTHQKTSSLDNNEWHKHSKKCRFAGTLAPSGSGHGGAVQTAAPNDKVNVSSTFFSVLWGQMRKVLGARGEECTVRIQNVTVNLTN